MKRILFVTVLALTMSAGVFAQRGRGGEPPQIGERVARGQRGDGTAALQNALGLTDAQVDAIKALMQTRNERAQAIRTEIEQKRQALNTLLNAASPSPVDVGNAAISAHASQKKLEAERDWFITELKKLLTGDQQQKLDTLLAANGGREIPGLGGFGPGPGPRGGRP